MELEIVKEVMRVSLMAAPMVLVSLSQYLFTAVSLIIADHLGDLQFDAVSMAAFFSNATGFTVLFGVSGALETLCGQAYGAGKFKKIGSFTYTGISSLVLICVPISIIWMFMDRLLIPIGFDPQMSRLACRYSIALIPALFGYAILQSLIRYFHSQGFILPVLLTSSTAFFFHLVLCWYMWHFEVIGAAISIALAYWFNVFLLALYMRYSPYCEKTRCFCFRDVFVSIREFWHFAFPSALVVCVEWWSFDLLVFLAGEPNSKLETSVLSNCIRVANEFGAGKPNAVRSVVLVALVISTIEEIIVIVALYYAVNVFGYAYRNDKEVGSFMSYLTPILSLVIMCETIVLNGIKTGFGLHRVGEIINFRAYYLGGIPISILVCFVMHFTVNRLWTYVITGFVVQAALLVLVIASTNWKKQATKEKERILKGELQSTVEGIQV
ncbi:protein DETOXIFICATION 9-like isoform X2 [Euphorbia lathyris]|uniref:protein DETOXIFICATION 9-like isoform X2 n=1 Tax=Euphorbia lathyris TaxID=212925 RepID=UPI0033135C4A